MEHRDCITPHAAWTAVTQHHPQGHGHQGMVPTSGHADGRCSLAQSCVEDMSTLIVDTFCQSAFLRKAPALWSQPHAALTCGLAFSPTPNQHPVQGQRGVLCTGQAVQAQRVRPVEPGGSFFPRLPGSGTCCRNSVQTTQEGASAPWLRTDTEPPRRGVLTYKTVSLQVTAHPKQVTGAPPETSPPAIRDQIPKRLDKGSLQM